MSVSLLCTGVVKGQFSQNSQYNQVMSKLLPASILVFHIDRNRIEALVIELGHDTPIKGWMRSRQKAHYSCNVFHHAAFDRICEIR